MTVDPDSRARTHLANERTFLAWFRTGLTLVALGLASAQFLGREREGDAAIVEWFSTLVIGIGVVLVAVGLWRYVRGSTRIEDQVFRPAYLSVIVTSTVALATALLAIALVWLLPRG